MAFHVPYHTKTVTPPNDMVPGNLESDNPCQFDIAPAWGADLARIKSIVFAATGLVQIQDWSGPIQDAVIAAFGSGAPAYINTVTAIRGLTIPAAMAYRAGLLKDLPTKVLEGGQVVPDPEAPYAVTSGVAFSMICGALPAMGLYVASEIASISEKAEADARFFGQPSGSGGTGTANQAKASTAKTARRRSRRRGIAAKPSTAEAGQPTGKGE